MTTLSRPYIAYSLASATWIATGATIEEARAAARESAGTDEMIVVFDGGDQAAHITSMMQLHRLVDNLKRCPVVWRGANAQAAFPQAARAVARMRGYYIREGAYQGTSDDRLGRWYVGREGHPFQPHGAGHASQKAAWDAAADLAREGV